MSVLLGFFVNLSRENFGSLVEVDRYDKVQKKGSFREKTPV
jgi:hypothetical protein